MKLGLCAHPADLAPYPEVPFDFIEASVQRFLMPEASAADFAPLAKSARQLSRPLVSANAFLPNDLKVAGPEADFARLASYADTAFARAQAVGMDTIIFGSGGARQVPEGWATAKGFEQYVEGLRICGPLAEKHGITLVVEPLNRAECNLVNTVEEGAEAVRRAGHPRVRLLVDFFHLRRNGESPDSIERHAELITHAHLAENGERAQPGRRGDDFRPYLRALRRASHCRRLTFECAWMPDLQTAMAASVNTVRRQLADAGY